MKRKEKIIYVPWFDENIINKHVLHEWNSEPNFEYFTSFSAAKKELIAYHKTCIQDHKILLNQAKVIKENDCH